MAIKSLFQKNDDLVMDSQGHVIQNNKDEQNKTYLYLAYSILVIAVGVFIYCILKIFHFI